MNIPNKIFAHAGGGLGDIYYSCLVHDWAYFKDIKMKNPTTKIHAVMSSPNPLSKQIVEYNPYIDYLEIINPKDRIGKQLTEFRKPEYIPLSHAIRKNIKELKKDNTIFINKKDEKLIKEIGEKIGNKYIVIHPFCNDALKKVKKGQRESRYVFPVKEYFPLIEDLANLGYKIVIYGGNARNPKLLREEFLYEHPNVVDLIDKLNARTAALILSNASGFIGTYSCFVGIAWWKRIKSVLIAPDAIWRDNKTWKEQIESWPRWAWATKETQNKILYLPTIENTNINLYNETRQQITNWF